MVRRGSAIGFFGRFGRSEDMRRLDEALRHGGLHPAQVPEGVKLAAISLMSGDNNDDPPAMAYPPVGELMAFCAMGSDLFSHENGEARLAAARGRLEEAVEEGEGLDAEIVLLMLHSRFIHPRLLEDYELRADQDDGR